jgi:hypothetical protein
LGHKLNEIVLFHRKNLLELTQISVDQTKSRADVYLPGFFSVKIIAL